MPEGPEVKRNTDFLNRQLSGKQIEQIKILSGRYTKAKGPFVGYEKMLKKMLIISEVLCKGKFIYFKFQDGSSLWSTLGMSAAWQKKETKHSRVYIKTTYGNEVYFNDLVERFDSGVIGSGNTPISIGDGTGVGIGDIVTIASGTRQIDLNSQNLGLNGLTSIDAAAGTAGLNETTASVDLLGSDGTGVDALDLLARMAKLLDDQNVPEEGRWVVAPPSFYEELSRSGSKLLSVDFNAGQGSIRNGLVTSGKLRGFSMYKSNNVAATTTATGKIMAGHISAICTAQTITSTEVIRDPDSFGDICRGLHVFGVKVLRPEALVGAFYTVD